MVRLLALRTPASARGRARRREGNCKSTYIRSRRACDKFASTLCLFGRVVTWRRVTLQYLYFINTLVIITGAQIALTKGALGKVEDIIDTAIYFIANSQILNQSLIISFKLNIRQEENRESTLVIKDPPKS